MPYNDPEQQREAMRKIMRKRRQKQRDKQQRNHAVIEKMTDASYEDMTTRWCVETRMKGGETREQAEQWCRTNPVTGASVDVEDVMPQFATDHEEPINPKILKQLLKADKTVMQNPNQPCTVCHTPGSISLWVDSDGSRKTICAVCGVTKDATPAVVDTYAVDRESTQYERCVALRMDIHGENEVDARASCDHIMSDPMFRHLWKEQLDAERTRKNTINLYMDMYQESRDAAIKRFESSSLAPRIDTFTELAQRTYIMKRLHGIGHDTARKYVEQDMMREGKLANLDMPRAPGETVGDLHGKRKEELIRENTGAKDTRLTVGDLYFAKKKKGKEQPKNED